MSEFADNCALAALSGNPQQCKNGGALSKESMAILLNQVEALLIEDLPKLANNWW
jgi:hypothetical protein